jgi:hypothetical protein
LASGIGHTIHAAELNAAENALIRNAHLFGNSFNLEETYLGERIKEYDKLVEVKQEQQYVEELEEEPHEDEMNKTGDLVPVKISSDEDSDFSD